MTCFTPAQEARHEPASLRWNYQGPLDSTKGVTWIGFPLFHRLQPNRLWGYTRVDELIWVKTNQLQRLIRTGRTGHWLNHGKEHCLGCARITKINYLLFQFGFHSLE